MNTAIFRRLLWKEFRQQWAFWVAMVFLATLLMVLFEVSFTLLSIRPRADSYHLIYIFCLAMLYALGCGATLFAAEHDTGTYQFMRNLPVGGFSVFLSKIMLAVLATASLVCVLYFPTHLLAGYFYERLEVFTWPVWCLGLGSALALGSFFSLLVKRPLLAAFLGGTVGCALYLLVVILMEKWCSKKTTLYYPVFSGMLIVLCLANAWLGRRWFRSRSSSIGRFAARWGFGESTFDASNSENMETPRTSTILRRLVWQQWRFSRLMMGVYLLGFGVILTLLAFALAVSLHDLGRHEFLIFKVVGGYALFFSWCMLLCPGVRSFSATSGGKACGFLPSGRPVRGMCGLADRSFGRCQYCWFGSACLAFAYSCISPTS